MKSERMLGMIKRLRRIVNMADFSFAIITSASLVGCPSQRKSVIHEGRFMFGEDYS